VTWAGDDRETTCAGERQQSVPGGLDEATTLEGYVKKELGMVLP
jgi:hypothetical protein